MNAICASCGSSTCGCCTGVDVAVPSSEANPPGLTALTYRAGTYATFYETMLARDDAKLSRAMIICRGCFPLADGDRTDSIK